MPFIAVVPNLWSMDHRWSARPWEEICKVSEEKSSSISLMECSPMDHKRGWRTPSHSECSLPASCQVSVPPWTTKEGRELTARSRHLWVSCNHRQSILCPLCLWGSLSKMLPKNHQRRWKMGSLHLALPVSYQTLLHWLPNLCVQWVACGLQWFKFLLQWSTSV